MDASFRIRYRARQAAGYGAALVVEDGNGVLYLFSGGKLQLRFRPDSGWPRASAILEGAHHHWERFEGGEAYPWNALLDLTAGP